MIIITMDHCYIALFFIRNESIALYTFTQHMVMMMMVMMMMMMMMMYLYSVVTTACYCSMFGALGTVVSFEAYKMHYKF